MIPTIPYIERKFEEFNTIIFGAKLPKLPIELSDAKTFLGQCVYKKRRLPGGKTENFDFRLRINTRIDLPEIEIEDTIIHEMIHYYIAVNQIKDSSAHGQIFRTIMESINTRYGRHISISHKGTKEQQEQAVDKKQHYHVIAVVSFHDGRVGIKVLPRVLQSILKYYNAVLSNREVSNIQLYMSCDIFFNQFPNSAALRVYFISPEELNPHLIKAQKIICDGKRLNL